MGNFTLRCPKCETERDFWIEPDDMDKANETFWCDWCNEGYLVIHYGKSFPQAIVTDTNDPPVFNPAFGKEMTRRQASAAGKAKGWDEVGNG